MCKFTFKMRVTEMLAFIGFTEILEAVDTLSTSGCELNSMDYYL
jgi:hypothetical protein